MTLKTIRLALARDKEFPDGATNRGYIFKAPLTADGSLDKEAWSKRKQQCSVERFWPGEPDETGHLVHTRGNAWVFHYDTMTKTEKAEAPIFNFLIGIILLKVNMSRLPNMTEPSAHSAYLASADTWRSRP